MTLRLSLPAQPDDGRMPKLSVVLPGYRRYKPARPLAFSAPLEAGRGRYRQSMS
jgi:hypothetical protein